MTNQFHWILISILLISPGYGHAALHQGEGVAVDPDTGNYIATYWDVDEEGIGALETAVLESGSKIFPSLTSRTSLLGNGRVAYRYQIANGRQAKQAISTFRLLNISGVDAGAEQPSPGNQEIMVDWEKYMESPAMWEVLAIAGGNGFVIEWLYMDANLDLRRGIQPGARQGGYGFISHDIPGVGASQIVGNTSWASFKTLGEGPDTHVTDMAKQMRQLEQNNFIVRNAAVPAIAVPEPYDAAVLLDRIRTHVASWPGKQLVEPIFASQLDRYLVSAADAYRYNQSKAAKEHIHTLRKMLAKEHHHVDHDDADDEDTEEHKRTTRHSIDQLAARVLDFDLRYVLKRMEQGHDKDGRGKDDHRKDDPRKR